jgi:two-component system, chemotaxis family, chemotaxis protein CheY
MKTALVVDDSKVVRSYVCSALSRLGFSCIEAENGQIALDALKTSRPKLVMLDWNMPVMSGIEFLREARSASLLERTKVVFCTTENLYPKIKEALEAGADEFIMKPFDHDVLGEKLRIVGLN